MDTTGRKLIFIDNTEATLEVNRARGFNSPGWWAYYTVEQSDGTLRYRGQECLVAISETAANAGDQADDAVAADAAPAAISIDAQPADVGAAADPFTGTFVVGASGGAGTLDSSGRSRPLRSLHVGQILRTQVFTVALAQAL